MRGGVSALLRNIPWLQSIRVVLPDAQQSRSTLMACSNSCGVDATHAARTGLWIAIQFICEMSRQIGHLRVRNLIGKHENFIQLRCQSFRSEACSRKSSQSCADESLCCSNPVKLLRREWSAASSVTCVLIPPNPNALTPARAGASSGHNSPSRMMRNAGRSPLSSG